MSERRYVFLVIAHPVDDNGDEVPQYWSSGQVTPQLYDGKRWTSCLLNQSNAGPFTYTAGFPLGDGVGGPSRIGFGALTLGRHTDNVLEALIALHFDGRPLQIYRGIEGAAFGDFTLLFNGTTDTPTFASGIITIPLRDTAALVDVPAQRNAYGGEGQLDGMPEIKGVLKPLILGRVINMEPIALDHAAPAATGGDFSRVVQIHDGPILQASVSVYERGVYFGASNHVFVSDVYAWTPVAAKVAVDVSRGVARFGLPVQGVITVDATEDTFSSNTHGDLAQRILLRTGVLTLDDIDTAAMDAFFAVENTTDLGLLITDQRTVGSVLDELAESAGAFWTFSAAGKFSMRKIAFGPAVATITADRLVEPLRHAPLPPPVWQFKFGAVPVERVLGDTDIGGAAILPADRARMGQAFTYTTHEYSIAQSVRTLARTMSKNSRFPDTTSGGLEGARQATLLKFNRQSFVAKARLPYGTVQLGDTVKLVYPDFGLDAGKFFIVRELEEQPGYERRKDMATLTLWGPGYGFGDDYPDAEPT